MKRKFYLPKTEKAQSLVELAISLVILLYLLSGAVEFGIVFFKYVQLRDAAQEGALYGSINPTDTTGIETRARASSDKPIDLTINDVDTGATVTITFPDGQACESYAIQVVVTHNHRIFMPFLPQLISRDSFQLNGSVTDTILSPVCPPPPGP